MTKIYLFSSNGAKIKTLLSENRPSGKNKLMSDFSDLKRGIYFCKIVSSGMSKSAKIVVI